MLEDRLSNNDREARRRVQQAAAILESAIRLGADPEYARGMMATAVAVGAEQLAQDTIEAFEGAS